MTHKEIISLFESFKGKRVLIAGDIMLDSYIWGKSQRISPEAPVPIVEVKKREERLGGAANVALNIKSLGAEAVLCSIIGEDEKAETVLNLMKKQGLSTTGILRSNERQTTVKFRVISNGQHLLRVDEEINKDIDTLLSQWFSDHIKHIISTENIDAVIFEDYDKGVLNHKVITESIEFANKKKIPITADPKKRNFKSYKKLSLFKPNFKEFTEGIQEELDRTQIEELKEIGKKYASESDNEILMITLSDKGVCMSDKNTSNIYPVEKRQVADVSGAGDTVISVATLCLLNNLSKEDIALISNTAGGLVCEKSGVVPVNKDELIAELQKFYK